MLKTTTFSRLTAAACVCWFLLIAAPAVWPQKASHLREIVAAIAGGADSAERRVAITRQLETAGVGFQLEEFTDRRARKGTNIVVTIPGKGPKTLLVGAHYDRVAVGQGAVDNGASCAVLLDLIATFKSKPLTGYGLTVVFFDLEEGGLSGSQAYFAASREKGPPTQAVNLDIFAYGDAIFATSSKTDGVLQGALERAGRELGIPVRLSPEAQYPSSDHRSMITAGIETLGMSLLAEGEIDSVIGVVARRSSDLPPILRIIHTAQDTLAGIKAEEIEKAIPLLERMIRLVDEKE